MVRMTQHLWVPYEHPPETVGVTSIIRHIALKLGKFTKDDERDELPLRMLVGMGWEAVTVQLYPDIWWQPGVYERDGISGHPDGFSEVFLPHAEPCVDEWKYTAKSLRVPGGREDQYKDIRDEWIWQAQVMAYLKLHPAEPVHARFHVCWAMGNYTKHTLDERYLRYLVQYDRDEIDRNWQMLVNHKDDVLRGTI